MLEFFFSSIRTWWPFQLINDRCQARPPSTFQRSFLRWHFTNWAATSISLMDWSGRITRSSVSIWTFFLAERCKFKPQILYQWASCLLSTHTGAKNHQFIQKFTFWKSHFSQNSQFQSLIFGKIHNFKVSFLAKFTISKSLFWQNSQFKSLIFHKIHIFKHQIPCNYVGINYKRLQTYSK